MSTFLSGTSARSMFSVAVPSGWQKRIPASLDSCPLPYMGLFLSSDFIRFMLSLYGYMGYMVPRHWWWSCRTGGNLVFLEEARGKSVSPSLVHAVCLGDIFCSHLCNPSNPATPSELFFYLPWTHETHPVATASR